MAFEYGSIELLIAEELSPIALAVNTVAFIEVGRLVESVDVGQLTQSQVEAVHDKDAIQVSGQAFFDGAFMPGPEAANLLYHVVKVCREYGQEKVSAVLLAWMTEINELVEARSSH